MVQYVDFTVWKMDPKVRDLRLMLAHFQPMFHFYTPENIRKPEVF